MKTIQQPTLDEDAAGLAEAFKATAGGSGTADTVCVYVDPKNAATQLAVALYGNAGGHPGALLTSGSLSTVVNGQVNAIPVTPVPLVSGTVYWIALLSPSGSGALRFRDHCCTGHGALPSGPSENSATKTLTALPSTWSTGKIWPTDGLPIAWAAASPAPNQPPTATSQQVTTPEDTPLPITLGATDPDGDPLTFTLQSQPAHGTLSGTAPNLVYTPEADYNGGDSFSFVANDPTHQSSPATLAITVTEVNDPPSAKPDHFEVGANEPTSIPGADIVHNDSPGPANESGQTLHVGSATAGPDTHGTVAVSGDHVTYTPATGYTGPASFTYAVCDNGTTNGHPDPLCTNGGVVTLDVVPPDNPPTADSQSLTTPEDVPLPVTLTGHDADGDTLLYGIVDAPQHGALIGIAPALTYVPSPDYFGPDTFTFTTFDGRAHSDVATVTLKVTEVNDPPVLGVDTFVLGGAGTLAPPPPRPACSGLIGTLYGDPHLNTFDRGHYDVQPVGELVAAKSTTDDFELQIRTAPWPNRRDVSLVTAVALRIGGHRIGLYRTTTGTDVLVDGSPFTVPASPATLPGGATIGTYGSTTDVVVVAPDGSTVTVGARSSFRLHYDVTACLAAARAGHVVGLLGNADGRPENDITTSDGQTLAYPNPPFASLYPAYVDSWRVTDQTTLFDYPAGENTDNFTDRTFPDRAATPDSFPADVRAAATTTCGQAGVVAADVLDACIVDVAATGENGFAADAAAAQQTAYGVDVGKPSAVTIATPGGTALRTFTADAGQLMTLKLTDNTIAGLDVTIRSPSGTFVASQFISGDSVFHDTITLPESGTYTIAFDARDTNTGSLTFVLGNVPQNTGTTPVGAPTTVTITTPGENAVRAFTTASEQLVTLSISGNTIPGADVFLRTSNGTFVASQFLSGDSAFHDVIDLPAGSYTLTVDPRAENTGHATFELDPVPQNTGTTSVGTPTTVSIGTVGENAVRTFTTSVDQNVVLFVSSNTISGADLTIRSSSGTFVASQFVSGDTAFHDVFALPAGTYTMTVDPRQQNTGSLTFLLSPVPDNTGTMSIGTPATVTVGTVGENAVRTFTGTAGQLVTLTVSGNSIPGADLTVKTSTGTFVGSLFVSGTDAFRDVLTLPVTGTYTLLVDPRDQNTGSLTVTIGNVPPNTGTTSIGAPTDVTITTPGENAVRTFSATAGQQLTLTVANNTIQGADLTIRTSAGVFVGSLFVSAATAFHDVMTMPATGTYTITIDPRGQNTGSLTFTLTDIAATTGTIALGVPKTVTFTTAGQNATFSFAATAGQLVTIAVSGNTIPGVTLAVKQPDGTVVGSLATADAIAFRDPIALPVTGTYTIEINPQGTNTGVLTFTLGAVPPNTGTTSIGTSTTVTIGTPGESAVRSFAATAGQKYTLTVSANTIGDAEVTVAGATTIDSFSVSGSTAFRDVRTFPTSGTFTVTVDPEGQDTGAMTYTVGNVPDNTGTLTVGTPEPVTISAPGENAVRSFTATAGELVSFGISNNTIPGVDVTLRQPDGTVVGSLFADGSSAAHDPVTLPVAGDYTLTFDPQEQNVGSLTALVAEAVPPETGATSIGTPTTVSVATAGGTATRTFTGKADQNVSVSVTGNTMQQTTLAVTAPDGSIVSSVFVFDTTGFGDTFTLPADGTYTLTVDPDGQNTGALTFTLNNVPSNTGSTAVGTATPVTITTPGENATRTFDATAGRRLVLSVSGNTIPDASLEVDGPDGSFVASSFVTGPTVFGEQFVVPSTGTYSLVVDPFEAGVGSLTFSVLAVPDNTGTIEIGTPTSITVGTPGEIAERTFSASGGESLSASISGNTIAGARLDVLGPDGFSIGTSWFASGAAGFGDTVQLPAVAGTYTLVVDPVGAATGSLSITLNLVPDNTGTTAIGQDTTVTITTPGENATRTLDGTAGQQVTVGVSANTIPAVFVELTTSDGAPLSFLFVTGATALGAPVTLPAAGTYTVTVDPLADAVGALTFAVTEGTPPAPKRTFSMVRHTTAAAATTPTPTLTIKTADLLANDRPGPENESDQTLTVTAVHTDASTHGTATLAGDTITYVPADGYNGPATFTYTACDNGTTNGSPDPRCSDGTVSIKVTVNRPPTAASQQVTTPEDTPLPVTLHATDPDGDAVHFTVTKDPQHGTFDGSVYTPAPNFHGTDSFTFTADDGHDLSAPATVDITVTDVNDPPSAQPDSITGGTGRPATVTAAQLLDNDSPGPADERGQTLTVTAVSTTPDTHGSVSLDGGVVTYAPDSGFTGTARMTYTVCDDGTTAGAPDPQCVDGTLSVVTNLAPTALAQSLSTARNTALPLTLAANDPEGDALTFAVVTPPAHGVLSGTLPNLTYTPAVGFTGNDAFVFTASDAYNTSSATVSITVTATTPPTIRPDAAGTAKDTSVLIDVLANDTANSGTLDVTTLAILTPPTNGTAVVESGKIRYTPAAGVTPNDRFTYKVCDSFGVCGSADVTISAAAPNRPPVATADSYQVDAGKTLSPAAPGVLSNDSDPDPGDRIQARLDTGVSAGNLLLRSDGSFTYTPAAGFGGLDSFTYHVVDSAGLASSSVKVTIDVIPAGPLAVDDTFTTSQDNPLTVMPAQGVLANDRDAHSTGLLTASLSRGAIHGNVDVNPDGSFVYTPDSGYTGPDSFLYVVTDLPGLKSDPAHVTITVTPPAGPVPTVTPTCPSRVTAPTPITAQVAAPAGEAVSQWKVTERNLDRGTPVVLASGTGAPPAPIATFDPTVLVNGGYEILTSVSSSGGGTTTAVCDVVVAGDMKLGDYSTSYDDLDTTIAGFPVQVVRTYDSTDSRQGDFGVGWHVSLAGFRVTPNNRLGVGGWSTEPFGSPFTRYRFKTSVKHFVTVTEPGGRTEVFDLVPAPTGPLLSLTTPEYQARPGTGTTSTLEEVDPPTLALSSGSLAGFLTGELYDPRLFKLTTAHGDVLIIDRFNGVQSVTDPNGNKLVIDGDGISSPATDRAITFVRDGAGRITAIHAPQGNTSYTYSSTGDLRTFTDATGESNSFSYDGNHHLLSVDGPGGSRLTTLRYGSDGRITSITDAAGNTTTVSTDVNAQSERVVSPSGRLTTLIAYGADGNVASKEEVFGGHSRVTRYEYDGEGRVTKTTDPLGRVESLTYDAAGNVVSRTTPKGETWSYAYNAFGEPTTTTAPDGTVVESRAYDAEGNLTSASLRDGTSMTLTHDGQGHPLTVTDSFGTTTFAYDANGEVVSETDPAGRVTHTVYDAAGRIASVENPAGETTHFTWDALGHLLEVTAPDGAKQTAAYDDFGRLTTFTDSAGRTTTYRYDDAGRVVSRVDRSGQTTSYQYDKDGNLASVTYPDGSVETGSWDGVGRLVSLSNADTIVERAYNDDNEIVSERTRGNTGVSLPDVTLTYATDADGQVTGISSPSGDVHYSYDSRGRLISVTDRGGRTFTLAYDNADRLTRLARPNGVDDALTYKENLLTGRDASLGGQVVGRADYALDALGRRTSLTDLDGTHAFVYDAADRLTGATHPAGFGLPAESFTYDGAGNQTSWLGSPAAAVHYSSGEQLTSDGTYDYTYDAQGRLTSRTNRATGDVTRYAWNGAGLLHSVTAPDGTVSTYRYDGFGRRVEAKDGSTVRRFVYSGWNLQLAYDGSNAVRTAYVTAPGNQPGAVYEIVQSGTPYYPLVDGLGSVTALTDGSGAVVGHERYSAFGVPASTGVVDNGFTFTGHQYDSATGLIYARERYYDPTTGRFISQDPDPSVNPYTYAFDAPTDLTDPLGRATLIERIKLLLFGPGPSAGYIASQAARDERARQAAILAAQKAAELQVTVVQATRIFINDTWKPGGGM